MPFALEIVLTAFAAVLAVPSAFLALQCAIAAVGRNQESAANEATESGSSSRLERVVVLIPAHNEERSIAQTLASVLPQLADARDAVVVADNCDDATAEVARSCGATAVERTDGERRGKGYALDYGVRSMEHDPPAVVIVLDADCRLYPGSVAALRERIVATDRPAQALNLSDASAATNPTQAVALFANRIVNLVRPTAGEALGMSCRLMGTGMAFPWTAIQSAPLATGNLVEDLQLGVDLIVKNVRPTFCPAARVTTDLPGCEKSFRSQRTRWEQGHLAAATKQVPRLIGETLRQRRPDLLWTALDLAVPPLSLLVATSLLAWTALGLSALLFGVGLAAWALLTCVGVGAAFGLSLAWLRYCRQQIPLATMALAPGYVLAKLPIYASMVVRRQKVWVRTERGSA